MTKLDLNKPIQTRDGRKARIICTDRVGKFPIVVLMTQKTNSHEEVCTYTEDGYYYRSQTDCECDLVNVPEQKEKWLNMYPYDTGSSHHYAYNSLEAANKCASNDRLGVLHITYEDDKIVKTEYIEV